MPPSPRSLLWPTILIPKKLYFSVREKERDEYQHSASSEHQQKSQTVYVYISLCREINQSHRSVRVTHVKCNGDDVEAHCGVCDTAEG